MKRNNARQVLLFCSVLFFFFVPQLFAEWSTQTLGEMDTRLYMPSSDPLMDGKRALYVVLHGCIQNADAYVTAGGFDQVAEEYGMIVAVPNVPDGGKIAGCWDYYGDSHTRSNKHNKNVLQLVSALISDTRLNIDPNQVYLAGLSSGGGQAYVLAALAPDVFAGVGINAGPALGTTSFQIGSCPDGYTASQQVKKANDLAGSYKRHFDSQLVAIAHGTSDDTVGQCYADLEFNAFASLYGAGTHLTFPVSDLEGVNPGGTGELYADDQGPRVSLIMVQGMGHAWPGGTGTRASFIEADNVNWAAYTTQFFFDNNRRVSGNNAPDVRITSGEQDGDYLKVTGMATDPDEGDAVDTITIKFIGDDQQGNEIELISETAIDNYDGNTFAHSVKWPQNDTIYVPVVTAMDSNKATTAVKGPEIAVGHAPVPPPVSFLEETGTITDHIRRYTNYPNDDDPDASSNGWGLCDRTYQELFYEFGTSGSFTIYGTADEKVWAIDPSNLPAANFSLIQESGRDQ